MTELYRIIAPQFTVGILFVNGQAAQVPPTMGFMLNWTYQRIFDYCMVRGWAFEKVNSL